MTDAEVLLSLIKEIQYEKVRAQNLVLELKTRLEDVTAKYNESEGRSQARKDNLDDLVTAVESLKESPTKHKLDTDGYCAHCEAWDKVQGVLDKV